MKYLNCLIERRPVLDEIQNKTTNPTQMNFDQLSQLPTGLKKQIST